MRHGTARGGSSKRVPDRRGIPRAFWIFQAAMGRIAAAYVLQLAAIPLLMRVKRAR
ncbi:hypothetical protein NGF19_06250 [Streptomyces sp. RY43-2]|uniref:Uncharacterized protein n=1 Tax=Streptomyces macrolidinus TaxID=2952607 RepID=A0ABT0Z9F3_9ACTN|nr:hypothetical protein [Streptomyces macrolidinus]MCN9240400.1 hypothetical protein [Streptomyces macrolidinus]